MQPKEAANGSEIKLSLGRMVSLTGRTRTAKLAVSRQISECEEPVLRKKGCWLLHLRIGASMKVDGQGLV